MAVQMSRRAFGRAVGTLVAGLALPACGSRGDVPSDSFKIGGILPYTGSLMAIGAPAKYGAVIAIDELVEAGRLKTDYNLINDKSVAKNAAEKYFGLKNWGLQVLVGALTSDSCAYILDDTESDRVFVLTPAAASASVTGSGDTRRDNVFQLCLSDAAQGRAAADCIVDRQLSDHVGIAYNDHDNYSKTMCEAFEEQLRTRGLEPVKAAFQDGEGLDAGDALAQLRDAGVDLVFLPLRKTAALAALREAVAMEYAPRFLCVDDERGIGLALAAGNAPTARVEGLLLLTSFLPDADDEATAAFREAFEVKAILDKYKNTEPTQMAAQAYDAIYAIVQAFEQASVTPDMAPADICEVLSATFAGGFSCAGLTCPVGETMSWGPSGEVTKTVRLACVRDGKITTFAS